MEHVVIDSIDSYERTQRRLNSLLHEEGSVNTAVALAEALVAGQGQELNVRHLRACVFTDAGTRLKNLALVQERVRIWGDMEPHDSAIISYNLANAQLRLWQLSVEEAGPGDAWLNRRSHLYQARRLFNHAAQHKDADIELRLKALADYGNSFDIVGRHLDALDCYERALMLDTTFGMASGNRGIALINVAALMGNHQSHVLLQAAADLDTAIRDQDRVLRCGGRSALETFERRRSELTVADDLHHSAA